MILSISQFYIYVLAIHIKQLKELLKKMFSLRYIKSIN